jgi:hypothetical protein
MGVALVIRDGTPNWWESPDIWVVPGSDPNGVPGTPVVGQQAFLWANVSNQGDSDVSQVQVDFWIADPSMQIRKSTSNHIGTAFADVAAGATQAVLCLVPWNVALVNGGHECAVVEASSSADPLSPPPSDPDVLDAPTYPQIAQRNLSVLVMTGMSRREIMLSVNAGVRADKNVDVKVDVGSEISKDALQSLGIRTGRNVGTKVVAATVSDHSLCGSSTTTGEQRSLKVHAPRGTSLPVYLNITTNRRLKDDEYAVIRVVETEGDRLLGGVSVVVVEGQTKPGGAQ